MVNEVMCCFNSLLTKTYLKHTYQYLPTYATVVTVVTFVKVVTEVTVVTVVTVLTIVHYTFNTTQF